MTMILIEMTPQHYDGFLNQCAPLLTLAES